MHHKNWSHLGFAFSHVAPREDSMTSMAPSFSREGLGSGVTLRGGGGTPVRAPPGACRHKPAAASPGAPQACHPPGPSQALSMGSGVWFPRLRRGQKSPWTCKLLSGGSAYNLIFFSLATDPLPSTPTKCPGPPTPPTRSEKQVDTFF